MYALKPNFLIITVLNYIFEFVNQEASISFNHLKKKINLGIDDIMISIIMLRDISVRQRKNMFLCNIICEAQKFNLMHRKINLLCKYISYDSKIIKIF